MARVKSGGRPPEDEVLFKGAGLQDFSGTSKLFKSTADEKRYKLAETRAIRIVANDLENIPIGLFIAYGSLLCNNSSAAHITLMSLFTIGRIFHTVSYKYELQPHRAIFYFIGLGSSFGLAVNGLIGCMKM